MRITARVCAVVLLAAAAWAQNPRDLPNLHRKAKARRKKHMQFHKTHNDTWAWNTFLLQTGMNTDTYVTST